LWRKACAKHLIGQTESDMKPTVGIVNPVAKAMLQERKAPQVIPPKKGNKRKLTKKEKQNALRDEKLY
jgi:hypothetical protein